MKTIRRKLNSRKINIVTLGCAKNLVDSEVMASQLEGNDFRVEHDAAASNAGTVIVNTCGFIAHAKDHSMQTIQGWLEQKRIGNAEKVYVTGCLSERYHDQIMEQLPELDGVFGVKDLPDVLTALGGEFKKDLVGERLTSTLKHYSYLKISEGCNRTCSFCVIPKIRGTHESVPMENLVTEAEKLVKSGTRELILIAQDLTYYGVDLYGERRLNELLQRLSDIDGLDWLRLHYTHPAGFPVDILPTIRERANICNYLDIPFQHISSRMLKVMNRGITREKTEDLIRKIREEVPDIALRTTLLSGHPGETEEDHAELMAFLREFRIDRVGVFMYSAEEDTHSFTLGDDVPEEVKQRRFDELMQLQQGISLELNQARVGQTFKTIIDKRTRSSFVGRTQFDSPDVDNEVIIRGRDLRIGKFYDVEITDAGEYDLMGRVTR